MNEKRTPPRMGRCEEAGLVLSETSNGIYVHFIPVGRNRGCTLTAEQAREAAHLLNQLAEYLEWHALQHSKSTPATRGNV